MRADLLIAFSNYSLDGKKLNMTLEMFEALRGVNNG